MRKKFKVLCFFGTRPEAIKMAPVVKRLSEDRSLSVATAVSAQHRDMLDQVLKDFGITVQYDLNLMRERQTLADITAGVLHKFSPVLERARPDLLLVHGDTTTTMAGTLAAFYHRIPVGHVEAGLRTHDLSRPFPEEMNRQVADRICSLYFAPTEASRRNLLREKTPSGKIFVTGNTVIDALLDTACKERPFRHPALKKVPVGPLILMTAHRRENFGLPFKNVFEAVLELSHKFPRVHWVYPVHPNPNVKGPAEKALKGRPNIHLVPPLGYTDLVEILKRSRLVVTDSGGLQEEAPSLGKPVLVLREVTERPEAVQAGTVRLVGTHKAKIISSVTKLLTDIHTYTKMSQAVNPYGDGRAAERIRSAIRWSFGLSKSRPADFKPSR